jgi:cytochrome c-type biogenesis protein CcmE
MKPRHLRLAIAGGVLVSVGAIAALVFNAFQSNLVFFYSPTQIDAKEAPASRTFRLGGLVQEGSVKRDGVTVNFVVTDTLKNVPVRYDGILPDLFKEGKGVVAQGQLQGDVFVAREVLAKHDENYMPPEAAEALKRAQLASEESASTLVQSGANAAMPSAASLSATPTTPTTPTTATGARP